MKDRKLWIVIGYLLIGFLIGVAGCFSPNTYEPVIDCVLYVDPSVSATFAPCRPGVGEVVREQR